MRVLGQIQTNQDIISREYMDLHGGKIDVIKVDNVIQDIEDKTVNIDLSGKYNELKDYVNAIEVVSTNSSNENAIAAYALVNADGIILGDIINIPKNFLVKDVALRVCEENDVPEIGFKIGDKYIDFMINIADSNPDSDSTKHVYLNVQDLVVAYTAGDLISIENNKISVKAEEGNGLATVNNSLAMNLANETSSGAMSSDDYLKLANIEADAQVNKIDAIDSTDFTIDNKVLKVADGKSLLTNDQVETLNTVVTTDNFSRVASEADFVTTADVSELLLPYNIASKDDIPTNLSQLANDTGFAYTDNIPTNISQLINDSGFQNFKEVVQISKDTITAPFIAGLNLKVGNEIQMADDAKISWNNVNDKPTIPSNVSDLTGSENLATKNEIPSDDYITTISRNSITSEVINGWNLEVGNQVSMGDNAVISWNNINDKPTIPTDISDLNNDTGYITADDIPDMPTEEYITTISKNAITSGYIKGLNLEVGNEIKMGENATLSWNKISDTENVANTSDIPTDISQLAGSDNLATKNEIPSDDYITTISRNSITSGYIAGLNLEVGKEILMSKDAVISWNNVNDKPTIPSNVSDLTGSENLATKNEIPTDISDLNGSSDLATKSEIPTDAAIKDSIYTDTAYLTKITNKSVTASFISGLNLEVGNQIKMGANATISWDKISGTENVATKNEIPTDISDLNGSSNLATTDDIPTNLTDLTGSEKLIKKDDTASSEYITTISRNAINSEFIRGLNLEVGNQIQMAENAVISWDNIDAPNDLATKNDVTTITNNAISTASISADQITSGIISADVLKGWNLEVGNQVSMGANAKISWNNVNDKPTIPTDISDLNGSNNLATKSEIPTDSHITTITKNNVTTEYLNALGIKAGSVAAENITGTTISGKTISGGKITGGTITGTQIQTDKLHIQKSGYINDPDTERNIRFIYFPSDSTTDTMIRMGRVSLSYSKYNSIDFWDSSQERYITLNTDVVYAPILNPKALDLHGGEMYSGAYPKAAVIIGTSAVNDNKNTAGFFEPVVDAASNSFKNGIMYLGGSSHKWRAIYCATGTIYTSDRNLKTDITNLDNKYLDLFDRLQPVQYKLLSGDRIHTGFIAQDIEDSMAEVGLTNMDFGGICKDLKEDSTDEYVYGLRYEEFIAINTAKIKQLEQRINELEAIINTKEV